MIGKVGKQKIIGIICFLLLLPGILFCIMPFLTMVATSLTEWRNLFDFPLKLIPSPVAWHNYFDAWTAIHAHFTGSEAIVETKNIVTLLKEIIAAPFTRYLGNTLIISLFCLIGVFLSNALVAYGFAKIDFPGRNILFLVALTTMMIPTYVTIIPLYVLYKNIGWLNTFKPLIVPGFFAYPFFIFLLRQFFLTIPFELEDAARLDGCSTFGIFWRIFLPLSKPALAVVGIFSFMGSWNDFFNPLIYLQSDAKYTLQLGMLMFTDPNFQRHHLAMVIATVMIIPCILIFFFAQRYFISGVALSGLKG